MSTQGDRDGGPPLAAATGVEASTARDAEKASILVVDDNEGNLQAFEAILKDLGEDLVKARSGQEALRLLFDRDFAAVVLDVRMPDMDGFETAEIIRRRERSRCTPIILVTAGDAGPEHIARGYGVGAVDFLFKPYAPEVLKAKVRIFLDLFRKSRELSDANGKLKEGIVERKRLEAEHGRMLAQLLQGQKLQAIGQLSAGIAHEINNPAAWIMSSVGTIGDYLHDLERLTRATRDAIARIAAGEDAARLGEQLDRLKAEIDPDFLVGDLKAAVIDCRDGAERIRDIVRSLMEFSHVDEAKLQPCDMRRVLDHALQLCGNELKYRAAVHREHADMPPVVCYRQQIEQVLINILVNAAQALIEKGDIFVRTRRDGEYAVVEIRDMGCGIAPKNIEKLFEPFFTTKPVGKGTGLGLYVAHGIVRAHEGRIDVHSEVGQGTQFTVRLPFAGPAKQRQAH